MRTHQRRWQLLLDGFRKRCACGGPRRPSPRLEVENLEERWLPSATLAPALVSPISGTFYTDGSSRLFFLNSQTNQGTFTGAYAQRISQGVDAQGNAEVFFTDGSNQLWRYDQGTFTNTGGYALQFLAGQGMVAFTDGLNELWSFSDATGFQNTGAFAQRFSPGVDVQGNPEVFFTDGTSQLWRLDQGTFTNTGAYAFQVSAGQGLAAFSDGANQLWTFSDATGFHFTGAFVANQPGAGPLGVYDPAEGDYVSPTLAGPVYSTATNPLYLSTGWDANGDNLIAFQDANNQVWTYNPGTNAVAFITGTIANQFYSVAMDRDGQGLNRVDMTDRNGQLWYSDQGQLTNSGVYVGPVRGNFGMGGTSGRELTFFSVQTQQTTPLGVQIPNGFVPGFDNQGNAVAYFTDGGHALWRYDRGALTEIAPYALQFEAGQGMVAFTDGLNRLWTYSETAGLYDTGAVTAIDLLAVELMAAPSSINLAVGWDVNGNNLVAFTDGNHIVWTYSPGRGFANTGFYSLTFTVSLDAQGRNQVNFGNPSGGNIIAYYDQGVIVQLATSG